MPKIEISSIPADASTAYPAPFRASMSGRDRKRLGNAAGLTQFGVNLCRIAPGGASSQRHWHHNEDEFIYVVEGEVVLCEDDGETVLRAGDAAAWKAGVPNGHCIVNRSGSEAVVLEVGSRAASERVDYPDIDMRLEREGTTPKYFHKSGEPY